MKQLIILCFMIGILCIRSSAQVSINTDGTLPPESAMMEVKSTSEGLLLPRLTMAQRDAVVSPAAGLMIYNTETHNVNIYNGAGWVIISPYCGYPFTDARDGKIYNTVMIGKQCWMAQNLNIGTRINGVNNQTDNSIIEKYCYNDDESYCAVYGGLYQWNEAMQYISTEGNRGICQTGWHLPSEAEITTLTTFLGGLGVAGGKIKEAGYAHWQPPNTGATNSSGFTALPGGHWYIDGGYFVHITEIGYFWSSLEASSTDAWIRDFYSWDVSIDQVTTSKGMGFSVRCIKD
jgi:uncharacterized protein (TIGR02145 family)